MTYPTLEEAKTMADAAYAMTGIGLSATATVCLLAFFILSPMLVSWVWVTQSPTSQGWVKSTLLCSLPIGLFFWLCFYQPLTGSFRESAEQLARVDQAVMGERFDATSPLTIWDFHESRKRLAANVEKAKDMKRLEMLIHPTPTAQANNPFETLAALNSK